MHSFHTDGYHNFFEKNNTYRRIILMTLLGYKSLFGLNFFFKTSHLLFEKLKVPHSIPSNKNHHNHHNHLPCYRKDDYKGNLRLQEGTLRAVFLHYNASNDKPLYFRCSFRTRINGVNIIVRDDYQLLYFIDRLIKSSNIL